MRNTKADRRSQRTRQSLSAALIELMLEQRYDEITVQAIIDRANNEMPYTPEQISTLFYQLVLPGVEATLQITTQP